MYASSYDEGGYGAQMRVLVTGAAGGVGRYVIDKMSPEHEIVGYDLVKGVDLPNVTWIEGNILDIYQTNKAAEGCDAIIHLAAIALYRPDRNLDIGKMNVYGTQVVMEAAARSGVKRLVYASSICSTGFMFWAQRRTPEFFPVDEGYPCLPDDMYGLSKLINEQTAEAYGRRYGIEMTGLRLATVWLPNDNHTDAWLCRLLEEETDSSLAYRDLRWQYVDVRDVAMAVKLCVESEKGLGICNVGAADAPGGDWRIWISDLYRDVPRLYEAGEYICDPTLPLWSIRRLRQLTGYDPKNTWREYPVFVKGFEHYLARTGRGI